MTEPVVFDLSFRARIPPEVSLAYPRVAQEIRASFAELIDSLGAAHQNSLEFWLASADLRNQTLCRLFHDLIVLKIIQSENHLFPKGSEIRLDSEPLIRLLNTSVKREGDTFTIVSRRGWFSHLRYVARKEAFRLKTYIVFLAEVMTVRLNAPGRSGKNASAGEIDSIIDTYAIPGFETDDRYYPGLYDALSAAQKSRIRFAPKFADMTRIQLKRATKNLAQHPEKFLLRETFLKSRDIVSILSVCLRINRLRITGLQFYSVDVSKLVESELRSADRLHGSLRGALGYFFVKRLKEAKIFPKRAISWFEGQAIDRGWSLGFGNFMPEVDTLGYQGFVGGPMSSKVNNSEAVALAVPKCVGVMGKGFSENAQEFIGDRTHIEVSPAFRFSQAAPVRLDRSSQFSGDPTPVLIALPGDLGLSERFLSAVEEAFQHPNSLAAWVKPHPRIAYEDLNLSDGGNIRWRNMSDHSMSDLLSKAKLLMCPELTSVGFESVLAGRPAIIFSSTFSENDLMPAGLPKGLWRLATTPSEILIAYKEFNDACGRGVTYDGLSREARESCLAPVNPVSVTKFLFGKHPGH